MLFELPCRDIFGGFYHIFHSRMPSIDKCPKIHHKYICTVTLIAQPPQRLQCFSRWHMKHNGHLYLFYEILFSGRGSCFTANWGWTSNLGYVTGGGAGGRARQHHLFYIPPSLLHSLALKGCSPLMWWGYDPVCSASYYLPTDLPTELLGITHHAVL